MLYHSKVFMPQRVLDKVPTGITTLSYGLHAVEQARAKYGISCERLPVSIHITQANIVEVELDGDDFAKVVIRIAFSQVDDICLPLILKGDKWFVKTVWLNRNNDKHTTLKRHLYVQSTK
jgi:hypothetical protein